MKFDISGAIIASTAGYLLEDWKMKKGFIIGLCIFASLAVMFGVIVFIFISNYINMDKWTVYENMPENRREYFSYSAFLPDMKDHIERCGVKGMRDTTYQIESPLYGSAEELIAAMPEDYHAAMENALTDSTPEDYKDVKYIDAKVYWIEGLPFVSEDEIDPSYGISEYGSFRSYMILEYPDGSCRFVIKVANT